MSYSLRLSIVAVLALQDASASCELVGYTKALEHLNSTVGGRLTQALPLAAPCFANPGGPDCQALKPELPSGYFRINKYQGFRHLQGEGCASDPASQCALNSTSLSSPANSVCNQGVVSPFQVEVQTADDVKSVFAYARQSGATLSIKNTGHDYVMRSSRKGSLALWTRNLREQVYHQSFTPSGCSSSQGVAAITIGAGISTDEATTFAHQNGAVWPGASSGTIGASGGWLLNGGHGLLSGTLGLAVDRVLEFTIVTPDGEVRVVNRCTTPDLFWALRGGGGGSFGVVLNSTHAVHPETPIASIILTFTGTPETQRPYVQILADNMRDWALQGWGGPSGANYSILVNPSLNQSDAEIMLAPAIDYVRGINGTVTSKQYSNFFEYYVDIVNGSFAIPDPISTAIVTSSRLVPEGVFTDDNSRNQMVDGIMRLQSLGVQPSFMTTLPLLYGRSHSNPNTSVHPAWYKSVWSIVATSGWAYSTSLDQRKQAVSLLGNATQVLVGISPDGGAYGNEASPWLANWSEQFWGDNYQKLVDIRDSVDPGNLLSCWHCVGWQESLPNYECVSGLA